MESDIQRITVMQIDEEDIAVDEIKDEEEESDDLPLHNLKNYLIEKKKKTAAPRFSCSKCNKAFKRKDFYERHEKSHLIPNDKKKVIQKIKCKFCPLTLCTNSKYLQHIEEAHQGKLHSSSFMCSSCGKQFRTRADLNVHNKSKCGTLKRLFKCKVCGKNLMSQGSLYTHMVRHRGVKKFMCRFCAKQFFTAGQMEVHERIHTQDKAFVCEVCNKGFCHRQSLITHSSLHTGIKPYQCENCGNSFSCVGNLIKHRKTHADTCGLIPLTSHSVENPSTKMKVKINTPDTVKLKTREKCRELEKEIEELKLRLKETERHLKNCQDSLKEDDDVIPKTENDEDESLQSVDSQEVGNKPRYSCSVCGKIFKRIDFYEKHEKSHLSDNVEIKEVDIPGDIQSAETEEICSKPSYSCSVCGKIFKRRDFYEKHEKSHLPDKVEINNEAVIQSAETQEICNKPQYYCSVCGKIFKRRDFYEKHEKSHLPDQEINKEPDKLEDDSKLDLSTELNLDEDVILKEENGNDVIIDKQEQIPQTVVEETKTELKYFCTVCDKTFKRSDFYERHKKTHLPEGEVEIQQIKCKFCPLTFRTNSEYLQHIEETHQGKSQSSSSCFICSACGRQFRMKCDLNNHTLSKCGTVRLYKCAICERKFMSQGSLYTHMLRHKGLKRFMCRFCAKQFYTAGQMQVHERIHTQEKAFVCEVCNKGFCHRESLITHSSLHTGIKPYQCENCGNSFSCVGNLLKHRKTHADTCGLTPLTSHRVKNPSTKIKVHINTPASVKLKAIEKMKKFEEEIDKLKNTLKDGNDSIIKSPDEGTKIPKAEEVICKKPTTIKKVDEEFEKELADFIEAQKLNESEDPLVCKHCNKSYNNVRWLFRHIKDHKIETNGKKEPEKVIASVKCSCCTEVFSTKEECQEHQQKSHADLLSCFKCEKIFANRDSLRNHSQIFHKGAFRKAYVYVCGKCGKQFKQKSYLTCHEERNCDKGPFFKCSVCSKQFSSRHTRNNHMRIHDPVKKLSCKYCAKSFRWKGQLKIHERSHTGEKPFACLYCPKAFSYRESLMTHSTIHTGVKPHLCEGCGSRFSCIGNLIKHKSSHADKCGAWTYKTDQKEPDDKTESQS